MRKMSYRVLHLIPLLTALSLGSSGCVASSGEEDSAGVDEGASEQEDITEAQSAFTASTSCTFVGSTNMGSGALLKMCVSISASGTGTFTVKKADGTNFSTAGTMHLKVGTYEPWGVDHASKTINGGGVVSGFSFSELFSQWPGYPKAYYARWDSQVGGYSWVGPITIYQ